MCRKRISVAKNDQVVDIISMIDSVKLFVKKLGHGELVMYFLISK